MDQTEFIYGGDYNAEQWLDSPDILKQDIEYMKAAHINEVTLGVFSWSTLEPQEGVYHFAWLENLINELYANGISVILSTPSAARPKWLADQYPEVLRVNADRSRNLFGGRHNHCYTSPVYRRKISQIDRKLSERFGKHPAVTTWHISNELSGECHCSYCQAAFQEWLEKKYQTIENLNKAWNTIFWSHDYQNFAQVESPSPKGEMMLHALNLDWKRFVTDQTADFVAWEKKAIREGGSTLPVTINMMYDFTGLNYRKFKDLIDFVSWDNYPVWHKEEEKKTALDTAFQHDFMRSILKKPFLLMESCPTATNWQSVSKLKRPGMLRAASLQAIAHGSDSVQYFQIRQSRGASEKFHGAVIDHYGGMDTRVFREVTEVGSDLLKIKEIVGSDTKAKVAILHDCESRWAMEDAQGPRNKGLHYMDTVMKMYAALRKQGLNVDILDMEDELTDYEIVFAPMLYMFRCGIEEKIREYVKNGGTLVMTYWSGIVNETDLCHLGGTPHQLMDVLGLRSMELDALYDQESNYGIATDEYWAEKKQYECRNFCDLICTDTAETLLMYEKDFYAGYPAFVRNQYGNGKTYYICADFEQDFYDDLCRELVKEKQLNEFVYGLPDGIEVTTRETDTHRYLFVQNFGREAIRMELPDTTYSVLLGGWNDLIEPYDTKVLVKKLIGE
ncbi:beta-galactosidase [Anaerosporobacter faecicola]|uniref:beta-galactosidase n=1 Tax=Anaerosporobacter faecicola TaxID=2718714 RepID=UPI00143A5D3D|nr:beta-galactosidase [Anaerosporobacter faecicola]